MMEHTGFKTSESGWVGRFINWLFVTRLGRVVGICLLPFAVVVWIVSSVVMGRDTLRIN